MTAYHPTDEAPSERLLLIQLVSPAYDDGKYKHMRASVVRRAVADVPREDGTGTRVWHDGPKERATGYRWAHWHNSTERGMFVDGLRVHAQIDLGSDPLNEGQPYVNEFQFRDLYSVGRKEAAKIEATFKYLDRRYTKLVNDGHVFKNTFEDACRQLMLSLGIKRCMIYRQGMESGDLSQAGNFREGVISDLDHMVSSLVDRAHKK